jgi:hypothetical protein
MPAARCTTALPRRGHAAITDDDIGLPGQDRRHQLADILAAILVIGVSVDDDVRAGCQRRIQAGGEGGRQPSVAPVAHDVVNTQLSCYLDGAIRAAVVDDQVLDRVQAGQLHRQVANCFRQGRFLVVAWNLNDQLHVAS